jgi:hypothetical protein
VRGVPRARTDHGTTARLRGVSGRPNGLDWLSPARRVVLFHNRQQRAARQRADLRTQCVHQVRGGRRRASTPAARIPHSQAESWTVTDRSPTVGHDS